jgi:dTDP-4-amino-4,6-dideoxygalactose transaminase
MKKAAASPSIPPVTVPVIDLGAEYLSIKSAIDQAVSQVMAGGRYILGQEGKTLEERIARLCGTQWAAGVNSGTDAILLILKSLGIGAGDEVITSPFTFFATVEAILHAGARPVFVDIDPRTFTLNPRHLAHLINPKTKAIIAVHLYGHMADMPAILQIARKRGIEVIEDMAQALGATWGGRAAGSFGRAAALSFYPTKNLGALGDGGMVLTNDAELAADVRLLRSHGAESKYRYDRVGYNSRLDELQAAVLNIKLGYFASWTDRRIALAHLYDRALQNLPIVRPSTRPGNQHVYHLYTIRTPKRDALYSFMRTKGVESGVHYPHPLHLAPALSNLGHRAGDFPESERAAQECLSLPLHAHMPEDHIHKTVQTVQEFFR